MNSYSKKLALLALLVVVAPGCSKKDTVMAPSVSYSQVDRMAIPAINTALIPANMKDAFNRGTPATDITAFRPTGEATITSLRAAVASVLPPEDSPGLSPATVASVVIPDIVTINFAQPVQFPNGRRLQDDVIDAALSLVLNRGNVLGGGPGVPDGIGANDVPFLASFPYLAAPQVLLAPSK